jgi:hypothetical protein
MGVTQPQLSEDSQKREQATTIAKEIESHQYGTTAIQCSPATTRRT